MLKIFCNSCDKSLNHMKDHLQIDTLRVVKNEQMAELHHLHFCGLSCLTRYLEDQINKPMIYLPGTAQ